MKFNKVILTNVQYGEKIVPPITLAHLTSQVTTIPIEALDSQGISINSHRKCILDSYPSIVCISFMSNEANEAFLLTNFLKSNGIEIVIHGGIHPTIFPYDSLKSGADFVIIGEADLSLPQLINNLLAGIMPSTRIINSTLPDLNSLNSVDWSYLCLNEYSSRFIKDVQVPIFSSRGCTGGCTFCYSPQSRKGIRRFAKEYIIKSIENAYSKGNKHFMFYDDDFLQDISFAIKLSKEIQNIFPELKWDCMASVQSLLKAKKDLVILINNGLEGCHVGIESLDNKVLSAMKKKHNSNQGKDALDLLLKSDLTIKEALLIALYENDTPYSHQIIVNYLNFLGINPSTAKKWIQFATPLPMTPFYTSSKYSGVAFNGYDTNCVNYIPDSFLNFNLGKISIKSYDLNFDDRILNAIKSGISLANTVPPKQSRSVCYQIVMYIYDQKIEILN